MKPTKNRVFCHDCGRAKMLFQTEKQALNFIKFNAENILEENGKAPTRVYYCEACAGWHVTSLEQFENCTRTHTQAVVARYNQVKEGLQKVQEAHKSGQSVSREDAYFTRMEKSIEKAETQIECGDIEAAKSICFGIIESLKAHMSTLTNQVRYSRLMARLTSCVNACETAKVWLKRAAKAIEYAFWHLEQGSLACASEEFQKAIELLSHSTQFDGEDEEKARIFHQLELLQAKLDFVVNSYDKSA